MPRKTGQSRIKRQYTAVLRDDEKARRRARIEQAHRHPRRNVSKTINNGK